jgi:hypothetical protein
LDPLYQQRELMIVVARKRPIVYHRFWSEAYIDGRSVLITQITVDMLSMSSYAQNESCQIFLLLTP